MTNRHGYGGRPRPTVVAGQENKLITVASVIRRSAVRWVSLSIALGLGLAACGSASPEPSESASTTSTTQASLEEADSERRVTLTQSTVTWETYDYELTRFGSIVPGSFDGRTRIQRTFNTWIMENEFLTVTLLPEFGGRILSIIYKPTGHEQLYQNPVGVPYQIGTGVFYYDWLMVYGGIFPTFPGPEHGKAWFAEWDWEVVDDTGDVVTVAMSYVDDEAQPFAPRQYDGTPTGLEITYSVTLASGRAAVDTAVVINNPTSEAVPFEYWTSATLAPGSEPGRTRTAAGAEIIVPVELIKIPSFWTGIAAQETEAGPADVYEFDTLRRFENWSDRGIAYAHPDMGDADFWGVIDQDTGEGFFRIADNTVTPGLKMWTWGFAQTVDLDPRAGPVEDRPYIELWAGLTREFFETTTIEPGAVISFTETYAPTVGLENVTHASRNIIADVNLEAGRVAAEIFGLTPDLPVSLAITLDGITLEETPVTLEPTDTNQISATLPGESVSGRLRVVVSDVSGNVLFEGAVTDD